MTKKELKESPTYWFTGVQIDLWRCVNDYVNKFDTIKAAARSLGISKRLLHKIITGETPESMTIYNFIDLVIRMGYEPIIKLRKKI